MTMTFTASGLSKPLHRHRVHPLPIDIHSKAWLRGHADCPVGFELDLVDHAGAISSHRHRVYEVSAVGRNAHDLEVRRLAQSVANAVDCAAHTQAHGVLRGLRG